MLDAPIHGDIAKSSPHAPSRAKSSQRSSFWNPSNKRVAPQARHPIRQSTELSRIRGCSSGARARRSMIQLADYNALLAVYRTEAW